MARQKSIDQKYRFTHVSGYGFLFESRYFANQFVKDVLEHLEDVEVFYEVIEDSGVYFINAVSKRRIDYSDLPLYYCSSIKQNKDIV